MLHAFNNDRNMSSGNTVVQDRAIYLHGNKIAWKVEGGIMISNCGWSSNTTKERLNALRGVNIYQKNFDWYIYHNNKEEAEKWNGLPIFIKYD